MRDVKANETIWLVDRGPGQDAVEVLTRYQLLVGQRINPLVDGPHTVQVAEVAVRMGYDAMCRLADDLADIINRTCAGCGDVHPTASVMIEHHGDMCCPACVEDRIEAERSGPVADPWAPETHAELLEYQA